MSLAVRQLVDDGVHMSLRDQLRSELEAAESNAQATRAATLRLALCAVKDRDIKARKKDECKGCDDSEIANILKQMLAQRETAAEEYDNAGKIDQAMQEREEIEILQEFLPKSLSEDELIEAAKDVVDELQAQCLKDMGRCVSELKTRFPDQVESGVAKSAIKKLLL